MLSRSARQNAAELQLMLGLDQFVDPRCHEIRA
jgi:hypothetical protein